MDERAEYPYLNRLTPQQRRRQRTRAYRHRTQQQGRDRPANHKGQYAARAKYCSPCHHSLQALWQIRFSAQGNGR